MEKKKATLEKDEVYLDTNIFILASLNEGEIGIKANRFLRKIETSEIIAFTSTLTFDEVFWEIKKSRNYEYAIFAAEAFLGLNITFINVDLDILLLTLEIIKNYKLDPRDAIHAACCLSKGIKTIVSEDSDFDKIPQLKRKSLRQLKV